jgi:hypothetical protein
LLCAALLIGLSGCALELSSLTGGGGTSVGGASSGGGSGGEAGTGGSGGDAAGGAGGSGGAAPERLRVHYRIDAATPDNPSIEPWLNVENASLTPVELDHVTLRYWFSLENVNPGEETFTCDSVQGLLGSAAGGNPCSAVVSYAFGNPDSPTTTATRYLEVSFQGGVVLSGSGVQSGAMHLRISNSTGANFVETNDYSYDQNELTAWHEWRRVTAYIDGNLSWGDEPTP